MEIVGAGPVTSNVRRGAENADLSLDTCCQNCANDPTCAGFFWSPDLCGLYDTASSSSNGTCPEGWSCLVFLLPRPLPLAPATARARVITCLLTFCVQVRVSCTSQYMETGLTSLPGTGIAGPGRKQGMGRRQVWRSGRSGICSDMRVVAVIKRDCGRGRSGDINKTPILFSTCTSTAYPSSDAGSPRGRSASPSSRVWLQNVPAAGMNIRQRLPYLLLPPEALKSTPNFRDV